MSVSLSEMLTTLFMIFAFGGGSVAGYLLCRDRARWEVRIARSEGALAANRARHAATMPRQFPGDRPSPSPETGAARKQPPETRADLPQLREPAFMPALIP